MSATLVSLSGFTFGIASEESNINVESVQFSTSSKTIEVPDKGGETRGVVFYDSKKDVTISGETTGAADAAIGAALTVANTLTCGGVSSSDYYVTGVDIELGRDALKKITIKATTWPGV